VKINFIIKSKDVNFSIIVDVNFSIIVDGNFAITFFIRMPNVKFSLFVFVCVKMLRFEENYRSKF
jgi:hypothetical protein